MSAVIEIKLKGESGHEVDIFLSGGRGIKLVPGESAEVSLADGTHVLSITQGDAFSADAPVQSEAEKPKRRRKKSESSESDAERGETEADAVEEPEAQEETDEDVVV